MASAFIGVYRRPKLNLRRYSAMAVLALTVLPASAAIVSETKITANDRTLNLTTAFGDWFVTPNDAHAGLTLSSGSGPNINQLTIEWDGKADTHTITASGGAGAFYLRLGAPAHQSIHPAGADSIQISVIKIDDLNLEANISGAATGTTPFKISGTIKLHRDAANYPVSGTWLNCDPVVHDKFAGAQNRSASDCEVKFDLHVRQALAQAFAPVVAEFSTGDWTQTRQANMGPVDSLSRKTEKLLFRFDPSSLAGAFRLEFRVKANSAQAQRNDAALQALSKKMAEVMKNPAAFPDYQAQLTETTRASEGSSVIAITVSVNAESIAIENFKGNFTDAKLPGGAYLVSVPYAQAHTGGDITASHEVTYAFFGPWSPATGTQRVTVKGALKPGAPTLFIQNICVEIQANPELAKKVAGLIDVNALQQLLQGK
jgi:hypothetical protein